MNKRFFQPLKIVAGIAVIFSIVIGSVLFLPLQSQAASDDTSIMKKTLANAISKCYSSTYIWQDITPAGHFSMEDDMFVYANRKKGNILVLDDMGGSVSCQQVFLGSKKSQGLNALFGKNPTNPSSLGYVKAEGENPSSTRCMSISYKHAGSTGNMESFTSNSLCFGVTSEGMIDKNSFPEGSKFSGDCDQPVCLAADALGRVYIVWKDNQGLYYEPPVAYYGNAMNNSEATSWDSLYNAVSSEASMLNSDQGYASPSMSQTKTDDPGAFASYTIKDYGEAAKVAFKYYTGSSNMDSQKFTTEDITYLLDKAYAKMKSSGVLSEDSKCFTGKDEALNQGTSYAHYNPSMNMWCPVYLNTGTAAGKTYNVVESSLKGLYAASPEEILKIITNRNEGYATAGDMCVENAQKRYDEFVQAWKDEYAKGDNKDSAKLKYYKEQQQKIRQMLNKTGGTYKTENGQIVCLELPTVDGAPETPPDTSGDNNGGTTGGDDDSSDNNGSSSTDLDQCYGSAGALGWILCPVLSFVTNAVDGIYEDTIQTQFLEVKASDVSTGSKAYDSWKVIRNIANILFLIAFIAVLLSQITGLGISNYGIKKLLPRLIVVAILVNASFFICQLAVDASNVLGYGIKDMFEAIAPSSSGPSGSLALGVAGSALTWAGIFFLATQTVGVWLIPLLLAVLSGAVSVLFGAIVLGIRQAGIIILVVLAPVAIVCYALPNSKSIFDRWLKMFTSLLMVFPICGALMGGGLFASNLVAGNQESVMLNIIAMLIRVVPFFMIPSLVRASLMAIGNIGNKITNWGNKMGRTATGAIAKSDFVRQRDADLARLQGGATAWRGRMLNRMLKKNPDELSDRRKAKIARQYAKYNKLRGEEAIANPQAMAPGSREYDAMKNAAQQKRINTLAENIAAENIDVATDYGELEKRLDQAMIDYNASGSDEDLATLQAFDNMLIANGDNGISAIQNSLGRATNAGLDRSTKALGQHLINSHTKDIKPVARELFGAANAAAAGKLQRGSFTQDNDGLFTSMEHLQSSISGYDASSIGKMNETSLQRMINNSSELKKDENFVKTFDLLSSNSLTNPNIHVQPKVAEKMNKLRGELGLTQIENNSGINSNPGGNSSSNDSGRIQIQGNNNGNGTIVQTGNDDRSRRPLPSAVREGNNYRQNDSGIWLPPDHN